MTKILSQLKNPPSANLFTNIYNSNQAYHHHYPINMWTLESINDKKKYNSFTGKKILQDVSKLIN